MHEDTNGSFSTFKQSLRGALLDKNDPDYDTHRALYNGMIDKHPLLIARCTDVADVMAAVNYARGAGLRIAIRGGGHNGPGFASVDDGLVIDLSGMRGIRVDPRARRARVEAGCTQGDVDHATHPFGLAVPAGIISTTGIAGLTLSGGHGYLTRKYGLTIDNLLEADVVLADGTFVTASETDNSDLFWALRGGGGNFGVVTAFEYRLHPVGPEVMMAFAFHDTPDAASMERAVRLYRDYCASAPDEVSTLLAIGQIPPDEHFPVELHRKPFTLLGGLYAGPVEAGRAALQPLLDFGTPLLDFSGVKPYVEAQQLFDNDYPDGLRYYWKSLNLQTLDDAAIARIVEHARQQVSPFSTTDLWHVGGAVQRVSGDDSAFFGRQATFLLNPEANWVDAADDDANIGWVRHFIADMQPYSDGSRYLNFAGFQEEGDAMMRDAFGPQYARLAALKRKYDPANLFRMNQNIKPE